MASDHRDSSLNNASGEQAALAPHMASRSVVEELDRQLEEWRSCLPTGLEFPAVSFDLDNQSMVEPYTYRPPEVRLRGYLIGRYYSAKSVIYRSFLYRALHCDEPDQLSERDKNGARIAVEAALLSAMNSGLLHEPMALLLHPINSWRR